MNDGARKLLCVRVSFDERAELQRAASKFVRQPYWAGGADPEPGIDLSTYVRLVSLAVAKAFALGLKQADLERLQLAPAKVEGSSTRKARPRGGRKTHKSPSRSKVGVKRKAARKTSRPKPGRKTLAARRRAARVIRSAAAKAAGSK